LSKVFRKLRRIWSLKQNNRKTKIRLFNSNAYICNAYTAVSTKLVPHKCKSIYDNVD